MPPPASSLQNLLRLVDGFSLAALRTLLIRGPAAARRVIGATLADVWPRPCPPVMDFWDLVRAFPVDEKIVLHGASWMDGCTAPLERYILAQLLHFFQPTKIVEVGTYRGTTTHLFLDNMPAHARIFTIDLPLTARAEDLQAPSDERLIRHRTVGADFHDHALSGTGHANSRRYLRSQDLGISSERHRFRLRRCQPLLRSRPK